MRSGAHSSTGGDRNVSEDSAEVHGGADAVRQELEQLRERMAVIKEEAAADVDRKWGSAWRTQETFDLKVKARLSNSNEYRSLRGRVQEAEAKLAAESDTTPDTGTAR
jgi:hypothetical protein